ncbi:hypothetical protein PTKIN_Ptkin15bG0027700 [Pterospermum kingtungense]
MDTNLARLSLGEAEDDEMDLVIGDDAEMVLNVEFSLVGRFLTNRPIKFNVMKNRMAAIWRPGKWVNIKEIERGLFLFQFFHLVDVQRVMEEGPWTYDNYLLILHKLLPEDVPSQVLFFNVDFWVQVDDLPAGFMRCSIGEQLRNFVEDDDREDEEAAKTKLTVCLTSDHNGEAVMEATIPSNVSHNMPMIIVAIDTINGSTDEKDELLLAEDRKSKQIRPVGGVGQSKLMEVDCNELIQADIFTTEAQINLATIGEACPSNVSANEIIVADLGSHESD